MTNDKAIGVFDSGIGGLTVLASLIKKMPGEKYIYFGDTARVPYGNKTPDTIIHYTRQIVKFLIDKDVKGIVVACNTVSSTGIEVIKEITNIPLFEVITPPAKAALKVSRNRRIGIIGTTRTISSQAYQKILTSYDPQIQLFAQATPLFVPLVEENIMGTTLSQKIIEYYLCDWKGKIDTLLLGCTHYPLLISDFQEYFEHSIRIIDSAGEIAQYVYSFLKKEGLFSNTPINGSVKYYISDPAGEFINFARRIIGHDISQCCDKVDLTE